LHGRLGIVPRIQFGVVDVRDVAEAHFNAIENDNTNGKRYIVSAKSIWLSEMGKLLKKEFERRGMCKRGIYEAPACLLRTCSCLDARIKNLLPQLGKEIELDNTLS